MDLKKTCDVLVLGTGSAGSLVSCNLARTGKRVIQLQLLQNVKVRPFEVLAPSTRALLALTGLREPSSATSICRGVISVWTGKEPSFNDYELTNCVPGLTIDRDYFHESLCKDATLAGVEVITIFDRNQIQLDSLDSKFVRCNTDESSILISTEFIIDATGRHGNFWQKKNLRRQYFNSQVALSIDCNLKQWQDCLIVEAVADGWFYIPPMINGCTQLVFMTDGDLVAKSPAQRRSWLSKCFNSTLFIKDAASISQASFAISGFDVRFCSLDQVVKDNSIFVGDSALALDPLSGTGTWTALSAAKKLFSCMESGCFFQSEYTQWYREILRREIGFYQRTYADAAHRFSKSTFWMRRRNPIA